MEASDIWKLQPLQHYRWKPLLVLSLWGSSKHGLHNHRLDAPMAFPGMPFVSSPFEQPECHSSTLAPQQSSGCIGSCYSFLPGCSNLSYFSLAYLWAVYLVAVYIRNPLLLLHRIRKVSNCSVSHGHKWTSFIISLLPHSSPQSKLLPFYNRITYCQGHSCQPTWEGVAHRLKESMRENLWLGLRNHHNRKEVVLPARFYTCRKGSPYLHMAGTSPG